MASNKRFEVAVNGSAGAFVNVTALIPCRKCEIQEAGAATQGLNYQTDEDGDNFATTHTAQPGEKITLGNAVAHGKGHGTVLGYPAQTIPAPGGNEVIAAKVLAKLRSSTVNATTVTVLLTE